MPLSLLAWDQPAFASGSGVPAISTRTLQRYSSNGSETEEQSLKERADAWKQAQAARRKYVTIQVLPAGPVTKATLQKLYESAEQKPG